jgi:hypothetical protein
MLIQKIYKNLSKIAVILLLAFTFISLSGIIASAASETEEDRRINVNGKSLGIGTCDLEPPMAYCYRKIDDKGGLERYEAFKGCAVNTSNIKTADDVSDADCQPTFRTYSGGPPTFDRIKSDVDRGISTDPNTGDTKTDTTTETTTNYKFDATNKFDVTVKGETKKYAQMQCDFTAKVCSSQVATLSGCVKDATNKIECVKKESDGFANSPTELSALVTTTNGPKATPTGGASEAIGSIFTAIGNLILAILTLIVWFIATLASWVFYVIGLMFLIILRVNPAAADWIAVAQAPWGVVQSLANLVILGTFVFVAFAYILNISQYKTKIDSFLTNIVIVAIVMNLTLLGCASIINISQGIGDAFVGGYARVKNIENTSDYTGIANVFIGETLKSFKKISSIRCNNVKSTAVGTGTSGNTPPKTGNTQTVAQGVTSVECGGDEGFLNLGNSFKNIFAKDLGPNQSLFISEVVYLIILCFGIFIFFRLLTIALIRAVSLWLLMVTSPLALVAYFSPEGFGIKKQASQWGQNFFHFTIFYPAFVFGLVLTQEMTGAFNKASAINADSIQGGPGDTAKLVLVLLSGIVAVGTLKLLADFFEGALKEVTGALFNGLATGGAALVGGAAVAARGAAAVVPGISGFLGKRQGKIITQLSSEIDKKEQERKDRNALPTNDANRVRLGNEINALREKKVNNQKTLDKYNWVNTKSTNFKDKFVNPVANFAEMMPEYVQGIGNLPQSIGNKWAKQRKARIDSFKEGDRLKREIFIRSNSEAFKNFDIDADDDPNAKLRGIDAESISESGGKDYTDKILKEGIKNAYAKSMGLDQQIARSVYVKRAERILKAAGGDFDNISNSKDRDFIVDGIKQFQGDGVIMSQMAENPMLRRAVGDAMNSKSLDGETLSKLRKTNPIFITDEEERKRQVRSLSEEERRDLGSFNWGDQAVIDGLIESGVSQDEINKKSRSNGLARVNQKELKAQFMGRGLSEESADNLVRFRTTQSNKGVSNQEEALARLAQKRQKDPLISSEDARKAYDDVMDKHFGDEAAINEIVNRESTSTDPEEIKNDARIKINELNRESSEMREYSRANASRLAGMTSAAVIQEMVEANNSGRESNKAASDIHFKLLDESAKIGAKALTERDTSRAIHDLNAKTFDNATKKGFAALADTNLQAEIGIQAYIKDEIKNNILNSEGSLASVNAGGLADTFKQHYEAISAASLIQVETIRNAAMEKAIKNAQDGLGSNPDAVEHLIDKFGNTDTSGNFTADNAKIAKIRGSFSQQGVKEANKLQQKIERSARSRQGGATQQNLNDAANEEFERKSAESKSNADRASEGVKSNYSSMSHVNAKAIFTRSGAPSQQSQSFGDDKYTNKGNYGPRIAEFGADFGEVGPVAPYGVETGPIGPAEPTPPQASTQQATQTTTQQAQSTSQLPQIDRISDAGGTFFRVQGESTLLSYDQMRQRMNTDYPGSNWS